MKIKSKLLAAVAAALLSTPALAIQTFGDLSSKWTNETKVPATFAVLHYMHGVVETVIVQEAMLRNVTGQASNRFCRLFKENGELIESEAEIVKKILSRFAEIAKKEPAAAKEGAPQMVLTQLTALYGCAAK